MHWKPAVATPPLMRMMTTLMFNRRPRHSSLLSFHCLHGREASVAKVEDLVEPMENLVVVGDG